MANDRNTRMVPRDPDKNPGANSRNTRILRTDNDSNSEKPADKPVAKGNTRILSKDSAPPASKGNTKILTKDSAPVTSKGGTRVLSNDEQKASKPISDVRPAPKPSSEVRNAPRKAGESDVKVAKGNTTVLPRSTRMMRKRRFDVKGALFTVVALGVSVGLCIAYKDKIMGFFKEKPPEAAPVAAAPVQPPPVVEKKQDTTPVVETPKAPAPTVDKVPDAPKPTAPDVIVVDAEEKKAGELISSGHKLLEQFKWTDAQAKYEEAARQRAKPATHQDAEYGVRKSKEFPLAIKHIDVADFAVSEDGVHVTMKNGTRLQGLKKGETDDNYSLMVVPDHNPATSGKSTLTFPKDQIAETTDYPVKERQDYFRGLLQDLESSADLGTTARPSDFYDLVYLSRRLNLGPECIKFLDKAFDRDPTANLGDLFRKLVVSRAIERATVLAVAGNRQKAETTLNDMLRSLNDWAYAKDESDAFREKVLNRMRKDFKSTITLKKETPATPPVQTANAPKPAPAQTAKQMTTEAEGGGESITVDSSGVKSANAQAAKFIEEGNKLYEEGMKEFKAYRQGSRGDNNMHLHKAVDLLDKALDIYTKAMDLDPKNNALDDRMSEAASTTFWAKRFTTLR